MHADAAMDMEKLFGVYGGVFYGSAGKTFCGLKEQIDDFWG